MEILSPAGNIDILKTAIISGADAVYFGGELFNARRNARNFTKEEILEAVKFAHLRDKKLYLTLNTIIYDKEITTLINELKWIASSGIDALIVQDLGLINIVKNTIPNMPLHASTQMSAHNVSDANALKNLGFERIVLAREMSFEEIKRIKENVDIETEVFIHGALCMCVSGQCYFSSSLGERSGNRGLCAQACRLPFYVKDSSQYNLSLKDLSGLDYISKLNEIGVNSLKIEGRMKNAEYVSSVTYSVKKALNGENYDKETLKKVFSRTGFTNGYLESKLGKEMFGIRREKDKNINEETLNDIRLIFNKEKPSIPIDIFFKFKHNDPASITIIDDKNNISSVIGKLPQKAKNKSIDFDYIKNKLSKLGDTPYFANNINGEFDDNLFIPTSEINELRRKSVEELNNKRSTIVIKEYKKNNIPKLNNHLVSTAKYSARIYNINTLNDNIINTFEKIYVPIFEIKKIDKIILKENQGKFIAELPRIFFKEEDIILTELKKLKDLGINTTLCHTLGKIKLSLSENYNVESGFGMNITNSYSINLLQKEFNIKNITLSPEIMASDINSIKSNIPLSIVSYGHFPLMITRNCPVKTEVGCDKNKNCFIKDRKGIKFKVKCSNGLSEIYNPIPIYIGDKKEKFKNISFFNFYFTYEDRKEILEIINKFNNNESIPNITRMGYFRKTL